MELIRSASRFANSIAVSCKGREFTYRQLLANSEQVAEDLLQGKKDLEEQRVAFITPQTYEYLPSQWGIWRAGGVAVPLCRTHPPPEWEYIIGDSKPSYILAHSSFTAAISPIAAKLGIPMKVVPEFLPSDLSPSKGLLDIPNYRRAMMIYTSGTTGKPKGVVSTHGNVAAQIDSLVSAWGWTEKDHILETLPLHHVHGVINVLSCALQSGAKVTFHPEFKAEHVWRAFAELDLSLFMGVPTMYLRLIEHWESCSPEAQAQMTKAAQKLRLFVSGSAALPIATINAWQRITGQAILERYGMTECGMILSDPLHGKRRAGSVGSPLPNVAVRLVEGEIRVKGPTVFHEYFNRPEETANNFDEEGWFKTGDVAEFTPETYEYQIVGRLSTDIIKSGGYKISALEIENEILHHPNVREVAVVGLADNTYGEIIGCVLSSKSGSTSLEELQTWCKERLASYKVPRKLLEVPEVPRNAMGKVNKKELRKLFG
jgi:malonyl-CoA/methylmalonyl-CoA synthetase